ncbi:MAG: ATP/GTP-binding protein [Akkermansia sp.]
MLTELKVKNFTRFQDHTFHFSPKLNVFVGENGAGKSHLIKLLHANLQALRRNKNTPPNFSKAYLETTIAQRLKGVFMPDSLGRLATRTRGHSRSEVEMTIDGHSPNTLSYYFSTQSTSAVTVREVPTMNRAIQSVFIPTRELLSIYPGFTSAYDSLQIPFDETWRDLAELLGRPLTKGRHAESTRELLEPLERVMGGEVVTESGRFYLKNKTGKLEAHLLADGWRKIATLAQLIANKSLTRHSVLFWDEPEANLNPKLIKQVAETIIGLSKRMQVFVCTHSLFLLRELYLIDQQGLHENEHQYFSMVPRADSATVEVSTSHSLDGLSVLTSLEYQAEQNNKLLELFSHGI